MQGNTNLTRRLATVVWFCVINRQDCNTSLVRACWNELFTLGLAQCAQVMSLSTILAAIVNHLQNSIQEGMYSVCCSYTYSLQGYKLEFE